MEKSHVPSINLAKNRGETFVDRFFVWALTVGRVMVIVTEAVALSAFLYRFGLDRQILDLHDRIAQEQSIVTLLKNNEATYRNLQDRLALESSLDQEAGSQITLLKDVISFFPTDVDIQTYTISTTNIHIDGTAQSILSLSNFVKKLKAYSAINDVSLDRLENKVSTGSYNFSITALLKPQPGGIPLL